MLPSAHRCRPPARPQNAAAVHKSLQRAPPRDPGPRRRRAGLACIAQQQQAAGPEDGAVAAAWSLLKEFTEQEFRGRAQQHLGSADSRARLREALLLAYRHPWAEESWTPGQEVLLGVVASEARLAMRALRDWCQALRLQYVPPDCKVAGVSSLAAVRGAVYVKYNSSSKVCYLSQYKGIDRGVLVQLGPGRLLGHFPLGFFDEAMANPEPSLAGAEGGGGAAAAAAVAPPPSG